MRRRRAASAIRVVAAAIAALAIAAFALTGCVADAPAEPTPSSSSVSPSLSPAPEPAASLAPSSAPGSPSSSPLVPVVPDPFTAQSAESETVRIADELVAILDPESIVNDDSFSQLVAASEGAGAYWGVLHTLTLDPGVDSAAEAEAIASRLTEAGWIARDGTNEGGVYLIALSSSHDAAGSWFVVVGADTTVEGQSVVTLQLASPALP